MPTSSGNFSIETKSRRLRLLGALALLAILPSWWLTRLHTPPLPVGPDTTSLRPTGSPPPRPPTSSRLPPDSLLLPTLRELTERHEIAPDAQEWSILLHLLRQELPAVPSQQDHDLTDAVKARFAAHAGAAQVDQLTSIYLRSSSMEIGQRALEILATLQSEHFQSHARSIISDATLPADDHIVTALARSLARSGTPADIGLILDRIDTGKARGHSEYDGLDGLISAIYGALAPEMEPILCAALTHHNRTWRARFAAATALQHHSTSASTHALSQAARHDADSRVAAAAAESLTQLRTPEK